EFELKAAKLDVEVAKAEFYPSLGISSSLGMQAFKPSYLLKVPESVLYSLAADITGPLINRSAIKAEFYSANSRQLQALYNYQRILLNAYLEVNSQLANINNLQKVYALKQEESVVLSNSITISNDLFRSSRADYMEILMTQRDALTVKLELIETKKKQLSAVTNIYQQLGGGWQ
ncbi:MAG: TolC family protein, partial [Pedobacter sp.]